MGLEHSGMWLISGSTSSLTSAFFCGCVCVPFLFLFSYFHTAIGVVVVVVVDVGVVVRPPLDGGQATPVAGGVAGRRRCRPPVEGDGPGGVAALRPPRTQRRLRRPPTASPRRRLHSSTCIPLTSALDFILDFALAYSLVSSSQLLCSVLLSRRFRLKRDSKVATIDSDFVRISDSLLTERPSDGHRKLGRPLTVVGHYRRRSFEKRTSKTSSSSSSASSSARVAIIRVDCYA